MTVPPAEGKANEMCLELVQEVIDERQFGLFLIPKEFEEMVIRSWEEDAPSIYGRFDLAYDGTGAPKLLEYNADYVLRRALPKSVAERRDCELVPKWLEAEREEIEEQLRVPYLASLSSHLR